MIWTLTVGVCGIGWIVDIVTILCGGFYDSNGCALRFSPTEEEQETAQIMADYEATSAAELWSRWGDHLKYQPQKDRRARALSGDLMPDVVDLEKKCATFIGGGGDKYATTLICCTCPDFVERESLASICTGWPTSSALTTARSKGPQNRKSPPGISPERVLYNCRY